MTVLAEVDVDDLILECESRGVWLAVEGDGLRCRAPRGAMSPELKEALVVNKPEVIAAIRCRASALGPIYRTPWGTWARSVTDPDVLPLEAFGPTPALEG